MYLPWCSSGVHFTLNLLQRWEAFLSLPSSPPAKQWRFCCLALVHCPHGVGTRDVNVWLHCLQIYSSHVNIAITWQKQYEMNVFVAHLSSHSWEIPNLLTFLAVFWGRVGRCSLLDVKVLFLLLEEKCCCQLNFWLWLKVFLYCLLSLRLGSWPCNCTPFACSDSCCPLWVVRNWAKATSLFLVLELRLWRGARAFSGPVVPILGHSGEWSPTSPDLGTALSVLSLTPDPAPALHREVEAVENPHGSWIQSLVLLVLAGNTWWK